jgi:YbbR domain-containing protein
MKVFGIRHIGLKVISIALATLLWLAVTGDQTPKVVPIVPIVEGEPAVGFRLGAVSASPPTVEVVGPASELDRVTAAVTEVLRVDGASAPFTALVNVTTENASVQLRESVRVRVLVDVVPVE